MGFVSCNTWSKENPKQHRWWISCPWSVYLRKTSIAQKFTNQIQQNRIQIAKLSWNCRLKTKTTFHANYLVRNFKIKVRVRKRDRESDQCLLSSCIVIAPAFAKNKNRKTVHVLRNLMVRILGKHLPKEPNALVTSRKMVSILHPIFICAFN